MKQGYKKISVYPVSISYSEMTGGIYGYCVDPVAGEEASKGKGWYGSHGTVSTTPVDAILEEETGFIWVLPDGEKMLLDKKINLEEIRNNRIDELKIKIKTNLSAGELALLKENINKF